MSAHQHHSRRGLLRAAARGIVAMALLGGGVLLALRNRSRADCLRRTTCDRCGLQQGCELAPNREADSKTNSKARSEVRR